VAAGSRPCPEYLRLEAAGARLVDWDSTAALRRKSLRASALGVAGAGRARALSCVLSDGEHVGLPLALALHLTGARTPHVMLGHHLTTRAKQALLQYTPALRRIDRILVHSESQAEQLVRVGITAGKVHVVPYGVDTSFWAPLDVPEERLIVAAGREHRDYATLAAACVSEPVRVFVTGASGHSPTAHRTEPLSWPDNVDRGQVSFLELRHLYARASIVVVPLLPTDFPAGVTAVLEAMAMGKAVVVTATHGLRGVVEDGVTGVLVPAQDVHALRSVVQRLVAQPAERAALGRAARQAVVDHGSLDGYVQHLVDNLQAVTAGPSW
jgi:glycosyltransferase involved in cell wall biosynthesis